MTGSIRSPSNNPIDLRSSQSHRLSRYGPLVIWAVLIFIGSSTLLSATQTSPIIITTLRSLFPHATDATLASAHFLIRKAGHFAEYAILAMLAARAFRTSPREWLRQRWFWVSLAFVALYSLSDEFHQSFVPSRTASIYDCMVDIVGGLTMLRFLAVGRR